MPRFLLTRKAEADLKEIARYTRSRWRARKAKKAGIVTQAVLDETLAKIETLLKA